MVLSRCRTCAALIVLFASIAWCSPTNQLPEETLSGFKAVTKVYDDCANKDYSMTSCLKLKALTLLDRVARSDSLSFADITISKNEEEKSRADYGRAINEHELENEIKTSATNEVVASESDSKLNNLILERVAKFLSSHNVNIKLPTVSKDDLGRALDEMRGKKNKGHGGMMMMAVGMKLAMLIPLAIGALFLLAGKALIISKIALVLALIITIKKLLASKHESHESHGWSSGGGGGGHGGWDRRSLDEQNAAQDLAYTAYKQ